MAFGGAFSPWCGLGCGVTGVAMSSNSETVTNLKPFASSSSNVEGIASIVPGWMSWDNTIEPGRVSLRIRLRTTGGPGRFQSSGSTSQRMMSYPNSSWIHRFSRSVIDPYGGRSNVGRLPDGAFDRVVGSLQLAPNIFLRHLAEVRMRPTVVSQFRDLRVQPAPRSRDVPRRFRRSRRTWL